MTTETTTSPDAAPSVGAMQMIIGGEHVDAAEVRDGRRTTLAGDMGTMEQPA